jgi:hypothetical protein
MSATPEGVWVVIRESDGRPVSVQRSESDARDVMWPGDTVHHYVPAAHVAARVGEEREARIVLENALCCARDHFACCLDDGNFVDAAEKQADDAIAKARALIPEAR